MGNHRSSLVGHAGSTPVVAFRRDRVKRKGNTPTRRAGENAGTLSLLPMEIQIGDRFTEGEFEWEVVTHPAALQGGKRLRARIRRPGVPESETEMIWRAHVRVKVRRAQ